MMIAGRAPRLITQARLLPAGVSGCYGLSAIASEVKK
jgi:hypothetical protein